MLPSLIAFLVAVSTWMTPMPQHSRGLLVYYGSDELALANAHYRGYTLDGFKDHCGLSVMSPADLGKIVWVRLSKYEWYGPCLGIDVGARQDFYRLIYKNKEVVEISTTLRNRLGFVNGIKGEVWVGKCPPTEEDLPLVYQPPLAFSYERNPLFWPVTPQQFPVPCKLFYITDGSDSRPKY